MGRSGHFCPADKKSSVCSAPISEMDIKTFGEENFDPKKWINKAWSGSGNQEKELFVSSTVTRLQLYMKQLTNSLDEINTQIVSTVPNILQDASNLQIKGSVLQQQLLALESKVQGVEEQTGHSIKSLQRIDQLKSRLEIAASALREADKWAALAVALEDVLESGVPTQNNKVMELSEQVAAMTASLEVLSDAPDYEQKRLQLETLYNRLEAAVSPPLLEALTIMDPEKTSTYVSLFDGMSRTLSVWRCWRRAAAARLAAAWRRLDHHYLHALTRLLVPEAPQQVEWLASVCKSETPVSELIRLYTDLLLSLEPSPTKVVSANLKLCSSPEEGIVLLTDLRQDIDELMKCIENVMETPRPNKENISAATVKELGRAAYAPLKELLPKYTELQSQLLLAHLDEAQLKQEDILEQSKALLTIAERCESWLDSAFNKAKRIAGNAVYPFYVSAVETFIMALSSHILSHNRRIETVFLSSANGGEATGVLSACFSASLVLESATSVLLHTLAERKKVEQEEDVLTSPLLDLPTLLLEPEVRSMLPGVKAEPQAYVAGLRRANEQLRNLARVILRQPVEAQLEKIPQLPVWNNNDAISTDLPDFALSPQEYITEIGQYLMTLPQHLEMHLSEKQAPWQFLSEVCTHTCEVYTEKILNIRNMDALGTKRCLTDIAYLSSVVEDLGTNVTPALKNLEKSLRAATSTETE